MTLRAVRQWRIATRILLIMMVPVVLMFLSLTGWWAWSRDAEIQRDLQERACMLATALAARSEYGVMSGNLSEVEHTVRSLMQVDQSVYQVDIVDALNRPLLHRTDAAWASHALQIAEAPIMQEWTDVSPFGINDSPHDSAAPKAAGPPTPRVVQLGVVRVSLSPVSMEAHKWRRLAIGTMIAAGFFLMSITFGAWLARDLTRPLAAVLTTIRRIRAGDFEIALDCAAAGEVGELQASVAEMVRDLVQIRQELENKVWERTQALQAARDDAMRSNAEIRRLIQKIDIIIEDERKKLTADIHDQLNATLIVVRLEAQRIVDLTERAGEADIRSEIQTLAASISRHLFTLYEAARRIVKRLRPEVIDTLGLRGAVEEMVRQIDGLHPHCRLGLQAGDTSQVDGEIAMCAFRLIQEAVSNAVKHSGANAIAIGIAVDGPQHLLQISVADNGSGFDAAQVVRGVGLIGMRERVDGWGGRLTIDSGLGRGTAITITLPVQPVMRSNTNAADALSRSGA